MSPAWRKINLVCALDGDQAQVTRQPLIPMRPDLLELFDRDELKKYLTDEELSAEPASATATPTAAGTGTPKETH
jgi:succinate dehydrogenase / fumarate reductase flavoprotein subunit